MAQVFVGLFAEGKTDYRFLSGIAEKALTAAAFECPGQIDLEILPIQSDKAGLSFPQQVTEAARVGRDRFAIHALMVHTDADHTDARRTYEQKILPAEEALQKCEEEGICRILIPIVPVQAVEAWMLADLDLLRSEIGATLGNEKLGLHRLPESIAQPKEVIKEALRIQHSTANRRRGKPLTVAELYLPLGQALEITKLERLPSFRDFQQKIRHAFREMGHLP